jgi:acetyl esterase
MLGSPAGAGVGMPRVLRADTLDREARAFLRFFNLFARRPLVQFSMSDLRQMWRLLALALGRRVAVARVTEHQVDGPAGPIELRVFDPEHRGGPRPALLWCHGGGFLVGGADSADSICRNIASAAGIVVVSVRYRLAPEHDLYAGREDFFAGLNWVATHGDSLGIDPSKLAIGGDSAGGNIAAAVAQECVRRGGPPLKLQVLAYPATIVGKDYPSKAENARGYLLTAENMDWMNRTIAAAVDLDDHWISPGRNPDLHGVAPALIVTAGFDPIRDDGLDYAAKLRLAGVPVELLHYSGEFHGFLNFDSILGAARDGLERIADSLVAAFHAEAPIDRTVEIADQAPAHRKPIRHGAGELVTASLMAWESLGQWSDTLLRLASPPAANSFGVMLLPWLAPVAWVRGGISSRLDRLEARQTHPTNP